MYLDQAARFLQNLGFSKLKAESILRNTEPCTHEPNNRIGMGGNEVYSKMDLLENVVAELVSRTIELKDDLDAANQKIRDLEAK